MTFDEIRDETMDWWFKPSGFSKFGKIDYKISIFNAAGIAAIWLVPLTELNDTQLDDLIDVAKAIKLNRENNDLQTQR